MLSAAEAAALRAEVTAQVNACTDAVEAEPLPERTDLYGNVYAGPDSPWT